MWPLLNDSHFVEFYEEFIPSIYRDVDWTTMVRVVQSLQPLSVAQHLHAFTSHWIFNITTAPSYEERDNHYAITIMWLWEESHFHIHYGLLNRQHLIGRIPEETMIICNESDFPIVIEGFIQRLLESRPDITLNG